MDRSNYEALRERSPPAYRPRIRRLLEFAADAGRDDVPDPYYGGANGFDEVLDLVEEAAAGLLAEVRRQLS
jgi:protein-tyrosine phosphatase